MKSLYFLLCALIVFTLSSFKSNEACEYAGSNMGYVKTQTQKAIISEGIEKSHYYAYRAINALEKSQKRV